MPAIVTSKFRLHNAEQFVEAFSEASPSNMYLFIGRVDPWGTNAGETGDDVTPPSPVDSFDQTEYDHWRDMISAKRVQSGEVSNVMPRYDWTSGTTYAQYDHEDSALFNSQFYVLNSAFDVYKCLFNNGDSASTVEPTGTAAEPFSTGDGYKWQYMFTITAAETLKFVTPEWVPVRADATTAASATDGALDVVLVTAGGTNYSATPTVTIEGDGTGATATATVTAGIITAITIQTRGSGYTYANAVITDGTGSGGTARIIIGPKGGHAFDPIHELGGFYVMMNSRLEYGEGGNFPTNNDYRKIGIMRDPTQSSDDAVAGDSTYAQDWNLTISGVTGTFDEDEIITGQTSGATGKVLSWNSTDSILSLINVVGNFGEGETIENGDASASASIAVAGIDVGDLNRYSGDILYVENRRPITRAADQIEDIKLIVEF
jgi:hypothetical protein